MTNIDYDTVERAFDYDGTTGKLYWKQRPHSDFPNARIANSWNSRFAWKEAGCLKHTGYVHVSLSGYWYQAHRIIWLLSNKEHAHDTIDHINGIKSDNRLCNLRCVPQRDQAANMPKQRNNTSGTTGVSWNKSSQRWYAYIKRNGRVASLGFFQSKLAAISARKSAEQSLGFHVNHGR